MSDFRFLLDDFEVGLHGLHAHQVVALGEVHAVHAAGIAAHRAHFGFAEQVRLAVVAGEENHLLAVGEVRADQLVVLFEIDGDDAGRARIGKFVERGLLHRAVARGEEDERAFLFQIARRDDGGQMLVFLEFHQAGNGLAARGRRRFGKFVHLQPVDAPLRAEQQNVTVRRGDEQILDEVLFARLRADAALAAARLVPVHVHRRALDVARMADGDGHVHVGDQVFELDLLDAFDDLRAARVGVVFLDFAQLGDDHGLQFLLARQDGLQLGDQIAEFRPVP